MREGGKGGADTTEYREPDRVEVLEDKGTQQRNCEKDEKDEEEEDEQEELETEDRK